MRARCWGGRMSPRVLAAAAQLVVVRSGDTGRMHVVFPLCWGGGAVVRLH